MKTPIYLDNHATTSMDPRVLEAMLPFFSETFGNAASRNHAFGWAAEEAVEEARAQIAAIVGAGAKEVVFTSGATESDNLALVGVAEFYKDKGNHIITAPTEHKAILDTCHMLEQRGYEITYLDLDQHGSIDLDQLAQAITDKTILVSLMAANNEIGTIHPLKEIGRITRERGVLFHTDATQGVGHMDIDVEEMNIDLASYTAHKIYGPKGCGALYVRRRKPRTRLTPIIHGGGHERGLRSGTLNVPGIIGFGKACEIMKTEGVAGREHLLYLRDRLHQGITHEIGEVYLNGDQRYCGLLRIGVHLGQLGTFLRAAVAGCGRRTGPFVDSVRCGPFQYRGGDRLRDQTHGGSRFPPAGDVPPLRIGSGWGGYLKNSVEPALSQSMLR